MVKNYINFLQFVTIFIFLTFFSAKLSAQCAGIDSQKIICDIENPVNQSLSLFSLLDGSPVPGGTWSANNTSRGLDPVTGILNAQFISQAGTYKYTYTAPATAGCVNNTAVVTLVIGPYAGVGSQATICSDEGRYNLFNAFDSKIMGPHSNGIWTTVDGQVVQSPIFVGDINEKTTYELIYTVPGMPECPSAKLSSNVFVTVLRAPRTGTSTNLTLCGTTDLAGYTNYDLNELLAGQDKGGTWTGLGITSETDHNVNLQEIFDTYGAFDYTYQYTVLAVPDNKVCPNKTISVVITLEKRLDFTGSKIVVEKDICESEIATASYVARITQGPDSIPNGQYNVSFTVAGPSSASETVTANFANGVLSFQIRSAYFRQVGKYTITVGRIVSTTSKRSCVDIFSPFSTELNIYPLPRLDGAVLTANPTCQNDTASVLVTAPQLSDGDYRITYNLYGDNLATAQTAVLHVEGGKGNFEIPGNLNVKSGLTVINIINIVNITYPTPQCSNTANVIGNLIINPLPNVAAVKIAVNDNCLNQQFTANVSGLTDLNDVTLSYSLSGSNSSALESVSLRVVNGNASFPIPLTLLANSGATTITGITVTNNATGCQNALQNVFDDFLVNPIPVAPTVNPQSFCKVEEATVANLVPNGSQYKWYSSETATTPLAVTALLQSGNYYVRETSAAGCTSETSLVVVTINDSPAPVLSSDGQNFCGLKNPTIADLSNNTNIPSTVVWYDAPNNGNLLSATTPLIERGSYYGFNLPNTDCFSSDYLEVTVTLTACDNVPNDFFVPDGFSPNGDGVNDSFVIKDIEFLYPNYTIEIYNRYGNGMYKGDKNKPAWDGKNYEQSGVAGGIAPNGVYFYVLHFNKDNKAPKQGRLYLNR